MSNSCGGVKFFVLVLNLHWRHLEYDNTKVTFSFDHATIILALPTNNIERYTRLEFLHAMKKPQ